MTHARLGDEYLRILYTVRMTIGLGATYMLLNVN